MASRTRNRVLGIAALIGVTAVAVLVILLSHEADKPPVTPLQEETANHERRATRDLTTTPPGWRLTPGPSSRPLGRRHERPIKRRKNSARRETRRVVPAEERNRTRRARSRERKPHRRPNTPRSPLTVPAPGLTPTSTPTTPGQASEPVSTQPAAPQPSSSPKAEATPEARPIEILIEDGELESEIDRVHPSGGHLRLRVLSDRLVVVEVEDSHLSWPVLPGGEAQIEFDTGSTKSYEIELRRRKGVLVLRLDD